MAKITNKKMYRDLMRMDGARMRDLNPMSRAHYAAAVAEPIVKTGAKVVGVVVGAAAIVTGLPTCKNEPNTPDQDPTCQEACTESQDNHLGRNDNGTLAACDHDGKTIQGTCECTEQTAGLDGLTITKASGVTVAQMNDAVTKIQGAYAIAVSEDGEKLDFKAKVNSVHVVSGNGVVLDNGVLKIGIDAPQMTIGLYMANEIIYGAFFQPQTKSTWLADRGNKSREWVAKNMKDYAASVAGLRNIAYDKANGISI